MIRPYRSGDLEVVVNCFCESVREIGARYYRPEQLAAWAPDPPDMTAWKRRLSVGGVFVADVNGVIAGFVRVEDSGLVDLLYVRPNYERRGVGRALLEHACSWAIEHGAHCIEADVSIAARPLFETMGFLVEEKRSVERQGVWLHNYRMARVNKIGG